MCVVKLQVALYPILVLSILSCCSFHFFVFAAPLPGAAYSCILGTPLLTAPQCNRKIRNLKSFLKWCYTDSTADQTGNSIGFYYEQDVLRTLVDPLVDGLQCNGHTVGSMLARCVELLRLCCAAFAIDIRSRNFDTPLQAKTIQPNGLCFLRQI